MTHGETKVMLSSCKNIAQVDRVLDKTYCKNDADKADYLKHLFNITHFDQIGHSIHDVYVSLAMAVIKHKVA